MAEPFLGEVKIMSFNYAPKGWAFCNGQLLPINQNQALFSLMGTMYGGNGQTTFALPNLQGRVAAGMGNGITQGEVSGEATHTLTGYEMPAHTHLIQVSQDTSSRTSTPKQNFPANTSPNNLYMPSSAANVNFNAQAISVTGGSQPHNNMQPYLVLNFCVALQGIFPSRN